MKTGSATTKDNEGNRNSVIEHGQMFFIFFRSTCGFIVGATHPKKP
ncbi:MAG: hypothetical protein JSS64_12415 [Bacteroidetes bacterium]|nr:hypothetical protein [Bacteroidota bacterium]